MGLLPFPSKFTLADIGDSHTANLSLGCSAEDFHPFQTALGLSGLQNTTTVAGSTTSAIAVLPGDGVFYAVNSLIQVLQPGNSLFSDRDLGWGGPVFGVASVQAMQNVGGVICDVITIKQASPLWGATLGYAPPAGMPVVGRGGGLPFQVSDLGISGNTTGQVKNRLPAMTQFVTPTLAAIYAATNDAQYSTTAQAGATTTTIPVATGKGAAYMPNSYALIGGTSALILSSANDNLTLAAPLGSAPAAGTVVAIDTRRNLSSSAQILQACGCKRILMLGQHYWNFASGGDTPTTQAASAAACRALQQAAANDVGAVYVDLYAYMAARITAGADHQSTGGSDPVWHAPDGTGTNTHLSAYGQKIVAQAELAAIRTAGWDLALAA